MSEQKEQAFLFIHGAGGTNRKWRLFSEHWEVKSSHYIDLPGRGDLATATTESIEEIAQALVANITKETVVVGHSMGGLVAIELAALTDKVKGVILVGSHYELPVDPKILVKLKEGNFPDGLFYASYGKNTDKELLEDEYKELSLVTTEQAYNDFSHCKSYAKGKERLKSLSIPFLAIYGAEDRLVSLQLAKQLQQCYPEVEVEIIDDSGHFIMLEHPGAVSRLISEFVERKFI